MAENVFFLFNRIVVFVLGDEDEDLVDVDVGLVHVLIVVPVFLAISEGLEDLGGFVYLAAFRIDPHPRIVQEGIIDVGFATGFQSRDAELGLAFIAENAV